ncbi:SDR family NAD(P)-dependent oxidoreductase [Steroidobacter sp.]|uniref:SDR family NAD(P)-dependent oxidoreductase n=1 Tax=Steroidobacter sp. TaxID=1978227 RepID=UPI001A43FAAF|nr:SDR family oxidoreductase [Steroidobacter sp.]MBL8270763.1 SDR family oxidoreductase [Steroidobacter sp.]
MSHTVYPSLRNKRVIVTGGGSGIGAAIVEAFAQQGARVAFLDIADDDSKELERKLAASGTPPRYYRCDLKSVDAIHELFPRIRADLGGVDILVNNAANDDRHALQDITEKYWDDRIAVNLRHLLFCAQQVVEDMKTAGGGAIVNLGSVSWHLALPDLTIYQTAKAGIEGLTRALARDLGSFGIRVNCVIPGGVRTPRQMKLWHTPDEEQRMLGLQCIKARVEPSDVANMIVFLSSDDARMCTGHEYFVDAGWR